MPKENTTIMNFRRRFVLITTGLLAVVTLVTFGVLAVMEYQKASSDLNSKLSLSAEYSAVDYFEMSEDEVNDIRDRFDSDGWAVKNNIATVLALGTTVQEITLLNQTDIDNSEIMSAAQSVAQQVVVQDDRGVFGEVGDFYFCLKARGIGNKIALTPKSELWGDFGQRAVALFISWLLLVAALFIITIFLSRYAARPVERAWEDQQRFIADASHELKTPLTVILADASILKDSPQKSVKDQMPWVESISAEAEVMQRLTEDMLTLAQADAGVGLMRGTEAVNLSSIVEGQVLQFDAVAFERGLIIEEEIAADVCVQGDAFRLENAVKTLLENACKYAVQDSIVSVKLDTVGKNAVLAIHNDGDPIPPDQLPHLFDRFYRSDSARTRDGEAASFGLGLSIAKTTVEAHKGSIEARSDENGTTFVVRIPSIR